jgi:hypothetical protein
MRAENAIAKKSWRSGDARPRCDCRTTESIARPRSWDALERMSMRNRLMILCGVALAAPLALPAAASAEPTAVQYEIQQRAFRRGTHTTDSLSSKSSPMRTART